MINKWTKIKRIKKPAQGRFQNFIVKLLNHCSDSSDASINILQLQLIIC